MSLMTPDVSAATFSGTETNTLEFGFLASTAVAAPAGAGPQFGEVLATLQPGAGDSAAGNGQSLAGPLPVAGSVDWAPALTVQALGEHLQVITPGAEAGSENTLEAFARAQGLDDITIGWLMGQGPDPREALGTSMINTLPGAGSPGMTGGLWSLQTPGVGMQGGLLTVGQATGSAASAPGAGLTTLSNAGVLATGQHPPSSAGLPTTASASPGAALSGLPGLIEASPELLPEASTPEVASTKPAAASGLVGLGASLAALWGPAAAQSPAKTGSGTQAEQPAVEPTESLMATLRSPAATALATLQRQLHNPTLAAPATSKAAANLRVSDLDLSPSLGDQGPDLQSLLTEWSARLDAPSASEPQPASALAAARGSGAMASSPLGLIPHGSDPQLGIDLADKFEQLAEKMGQAVAQRMLSELEKGHWHLKLMLRPATLGHIEVEMRMRSGELDASFVASQNLTRELLQESLPRLRETLTQLGMDVANMNVDSGRSQQGDGDPTPHAQAAQARTAQATGSAETSAITPQHHERRGQEGWDVMV